MAKKRITQETFDAVVDENMSEFGMSREEAVADARQQFESQGVDLANVVTTAAVGADGAPVQHAVATALSELKGALDNADCKAEDVLPQFRALLELLVKENEGRVVAGTNDCVRLCLFAGHRFVQHEEFVAVALDIFHECMQVDANRDLIGKDGVQIYLMLLEAVKEDPVLVRRGLAALADACTGNEINRQRAVDGGIIDIAVASMRGHASHDEVVEAACRLLRSLTLSDDERALFCRSMEHVTAMVENGTLETVIACLQANKARPDSPVAVELFSVLARLAVKDDFCKDIVSRGGLDLVVSTLESNGTVAPLASEALNFIKCLAGNDDVKVSVGMGRGLDLILASFEAHAKNAAVVENALGALGSVVLRQPQVVAAFHAKGGVPLVVTAMRLHADNAKVQRVASMAVRNIVSRNPEVRQPFLDEGAESVLRAARKLPGCGDVGKAALRDLGCHVHLNEPFKGAIKEKETTQVFL